MSELEKKAEEAAGKAAEAAETAKETVEEAVKEAKEAVEAVGETAEAGKKTRGKKKEKVKKTVGQEILSWVLTLAVAVVVALLIRTFIFEPVRVDGHSMDDTLSDGEIMFVSKFDYSSTWLCFPWQSQEDQEKAARFTVGGDPKRFDVVICRYPGRGATNFVKRVIGLPGDTIRLSGGYLYIKAAGETEEVMYEEIYINDDYRSGMRNEFGPYTVPEGKFFVMGDHRNNSNDSRYTGPIDRNMIVGHVRQVVYPFNKWRAVKNGLDVKAEDVKKAQ